MVMVTIHHRPLSTEHQLLTLGWALQQSRIVETYAVVFLGNVPASIRGFTSPLRRAQTQQAQSLGRHMVTIPSLRVLEDDL